MSTLVKETPTENLQPMDITTNHPTSWLGKKTFDLMDEWVGDVHATCTLTFVQKKKNLFLCRHPHDIVSAVIRMVFR